MSTAPNPADPKPTCWVEHFENALVIHLQGRIGVGEVSHLERSMLVAQSNKEPLIVVEMSQLQFISSLGLGMLVQLKRATASRGSTLRLAALSPLILELLVNSRLDKLFEIVPTQAQALVPPAK